MPIAARQPASAKSKISAKTPPAPGMVGRNVGQKVKVQPPNSSSYSNTSRKAAKHDKQQRGQCDVCDSHNFIKLKTFILAMLYCLASFHSFWVNTFEGFVAALSFSLDFDMKMCGNRAFLSILKVRQSVWKLFIRPIITSNNAVRRKSIATVRAVSKPSSENQSVRLLSAFSSFSHVQTADICRYQQGFLYLKKSLYYI